MSWTQRWKRAATLYRRNMRALAQELEELQDGREGAREAGAAEERRAAVASLRLAHMRMIENPRTAPTLSEAIAAIERGDHLAAAAPAPTCFHCRGIVHPDTGDMRCDGCGRVLSEAAP